MHSRCVHRSSYRETIIKERAEYKKTSNVLDATGCTSNVLWLCPKSSLVLSRKIIEASPEYPYQKLGYAHSDRKRRNSSPLLGGEDQIGINIRKDGIDRDR